MYTAFVIETDEAVRASICTLLEIVGFSTRGYPSAEAFLRERSPQDRGFLVTEMVLPSLSGLQLIEQLRSDGSALPAVLTTDHRSEAGIVPDGLRVTVIEKPLLADALLKWVDRLMSIPEEASGR